MSAEDWEAVKEIAGNALLLDPAERPEFIERSCAGRSGVREEVESLVRSSDRAGTFLETPALQYESAECLPPGALIGQYRITRRIAGGGMGDVYHAVRTGDFDQQAAIKILKAGVSPRILEGAFRRERQILAQLEHPCIARLLDGGTTDGGLLYFVMEYVDGKPLDVWCHEGGLGVAERVRLFRQVCSAVEYAHRNLVVHRDIKPDNILVTPDGTPKLVDFGIAKIVNLDAELRDTGATETRIMTPGYASPEQVRGLAPTTAADVYSLGVVLYELLAGRSPYRGKGGPAYDLEREICEGQPDLPSVAAGAHGKPLRGDLDNVVMLALEKDPQNRYGSVEALSEDLRRYLENLPVTARPATAAYRARKFVSRHKTGVATATAAVLALVALTGIALWQAREARAQRLLAEEHFREVRQLANSFLFDFHDAIRDLPGATPARALVARKGLEYLDRLAGKSRGDPSLTRELAAAYARMASIQGVPGNYNLGDTRGALASINKSIALYEGLDRGSSKDEDLRRRLAEAYESAGRVLVSERKTPEAMERFQRALTIRQALYDAAPAAEINQNDMARSYYVLGVASFVGGNYAAALDHHVRALKLYQSLVTAYPSTRNRSSLALSYKTLASTQVTKSDFAAALENMRAAVALDEATLREQPTSSAARSNLSVSYSETCRTFRIAGRAADGIEYCRRALDLRTAMAAADPKNAALQGSLAFTHYETAESLLALNRLEEALAQSRKSRAIREKLLQADPENASLKSRIAESCNTEGGIYAAMAAAARDHAGQAANRQKSVEAFQQSINLLEPLERAGRLGDSKVPLQFARAQLAINRTAAHHLNP